MKHLAAPFFLGLISAAFSFAASDAQTFTLDHKLQIPGATLKSGEYTFEVEDRLQDRAIIRITDAKKNSHELLLAVPSEKLNQADRSKLILFPTESSDKQILHGWMCPSCQTALEIVYPKGEAVKITQVSAKPVLAVDPTYDKLPKNLSADDMKVVTLWLLSPKEVTPDQKGKGLEAAKWADVNPAKKTELAENKPVPAPPAALPESGQTATTPPASAAQSVPSAPATPPAVAEPSRPVSSPASPQAPEVVASARTPATAPAPDPTVIASGSPQRHMPHTASNTFAFGLVGCLCFFAGSSLWLQRKLRSASQAR